MREKKVFCIYGCFTISGYITSLGTFYITSLGTWIFRHTCIYKQPPLTKYWNYNIFVQIWYSCFRYTDRLLLGCTLFVARCNIIRASCETKKHTFFSMPIFVAFFVNYLPLTRWRTCWIAPVKIHNIAMTVWWYHEWTVKNMTIFWRPPTLPAFSTVLWT